MRLYYLCSKNKGADQMRCYRTAVRSMPFPSVKCPLNPWFPWTLFMESVESLDKIHGYSGQSPRSPLRLRNVHGLSGKSGQCPWILWTKSREPTQTGQCPWAQWTLCPPSPWRMSMDSLDIIHGLNGSTDTLNNVQADWTMSAESMGSLDIVHGQSPLLVLTELA